MEKGGESILLFAGEKGPTRSLDAKFFHLVVLPACSLGQFPEIGPSETLIGLRDLFQHAPECQFAADPQNQQFEFLQTR